MFTRKEIERRKTKHEARANNTLLYTILYRKIACDPPAPGAHDAQNEREAEVVKGAKPISPQLLHLLAV